MVDAVVGSPGTPNKTDVMSPVVAVTAVPDPTYKLRLWTGACSGAGACSLDMTAARSVGGNR